MRTPQLYAMPQGTLAERDVDAAITLAETDLRAWRGSRILLTGATGFVGSWMLGVLGRANDDLDLGLEVVALARRPARGFTAAQWPCVTAVAADVRRLTAAHATQIGGLDAVVHLACPSTQTSAAEIDEAPATIVDGTRAVLDTAAASGRLRVLVASSGVVHGRGADRPALVPEDCAGTPSPGERSYAYGVAKRVAEQDAIAATAAGNVDAVIARLWAFIGPYLPLDAHYAAGNFVADALAGRPIHVKGDPATVRSYLYPVDLVVWLLAILTRGRSAAAYNVGSETETTIGELATTVARASNSTARVRSSGVAKQLPQQLCADRYVPDTRKARAELGVRQTVNLDDAVERTLDWHRGRASDSLTSTIGARI